MSALIVLLFLFLVSPATYVNSSEQIDLPHYPAIRCGSCPCVNPCSQQLPPPPPPPSNPSDQYCPPSPAVLTPPPPRFIYVTAADTPPPPRFFYVTGPPGNFYPTDDPFNFQAYSVGGRRVVSGFLTIVCCGILGYLLLLS